MDSQSELQPSARLFQRKAVKEETQEAEITLEPQAPGNSQ